MAGEGRGGIDKGGEGREGKKKGGGCVSWLCWQPLPVVPPTHLMLLSGCRL